MVELGNFSKASSASIISCDIITVKALSRILPHPYSVIFVRSSELYVQHSPYCPVCGCRYWGHGHVSTNRALPLLPRTVSSSLSSVAP
jgi:hypothetical protein